MPSTLRAPAALIAAVLASLALAESSPLDGPTPRRTRIAVAVSPERFGYIDDRGTLIIPARFEDAGAFAEGRARVKVDGRWGFIDELGNTLAAPVFDVAGDFSEGLAPARVKPGEWTYLDRDGQSVLTVHAARASGFVESTAILELGDLARPPVQRGPGVRADRSALGLRESHRRGRHPAGVLGGAPVPGQSRTGRAPGARGVHRSSREVRDSCAVRHRPRILERTGARHPTGAGALRGSERHDRMARNRSRRERPTRRGNSLNVERARARLVAWS
jgi:hypothetical protein